MLLPDAEGCITRCAVCNHVPPIPYLVPDRSEHDPPYRYSTMCLVCLDILLSLFPLLPARIFRRELVGSFRGGTRATRRVRWGAA